MPNDTALLPLSDPALDSIAAQLASGATVVGIGESTRFSRETSGVRDRLFRRLVRDHGFRALAVQDAAGAGTALDAYVNGGAGSAADALAGAWRPWRTAETAAALEWIRAYNRDHADDPVRVYGVKPAQAQPADYEAVLAHVRATAPERLARPAAHLDPIRTAHDVDEHVQRARGIHPGRPFADHAREALALLDAGLGESDAPAHWFDLRHQDVRRAWDGPAKARVISGVYTPERDAAEHLAVASLPDAFDVLIHLREATPVHRLP
ncbi:erythromycin esterase family protein [Kitasatospora sp. NPDC127059]|uniref:erythromycin esterase family protein n=1 Tax=unclassified Kitasatospora TaxID=2633591 RepID=UPI00364D5A58